MHLAKTDIEFFEQKRLEIIASFMDSLASPSSHKKISENLKNIDQQMSFQVVNNDSELFEQKRKEIISSFFNYVISGSNQDGLLSLQNNIENKRI